MSCDGREKALRPRSGALSLEAMPAGGGVVDSQVFPLKHISSQAVPKAPAFPSLLTPCPWGLAHLRIHHAAGPQSRTASTSPEVIVQSPWDSESMPASPAWVQLEGDMFCGFNCTSPPGQGLCEACAGARGARQELIPFPWEAPDLGLGRGTERRQNLPFRSRVPAQVV